MKHSPFDAMILALDVATSAVGTTIQSPGMAKLVLGAAISELNVEFLAISAIGVLV